MVGEFQPRLLPEKPMTAERLLSPSRPSSSPAKWELTQSIGRNVLRFNWVVEGVISARFISYGSADECQLSGEEVQAIPTTVLGCLLALSATV